MSDEFEERAAIMEFLGNLPREVAEARARESLGLLPELRDDDLDVPFDEYADFV